MSRTMSVAAGILAVLAWACAAPATQYTLTDLGTLGGSELNTWATGINNVGQVVGQSGEHAFLYSGGVMQDLGTLGGAWSLATSINHVGQVVGASDTVGYLNRHAFLYSGGVMADLGTLGASLSYAYATGINNAGQVVGAARATATNDHAFLYSGGVMQDLGTLGGSHSNADGINNSGQVVGTASLASGEQHAFLYSGGVMQDLGTLGWSSHALGINYVGQVVGYSYTTVESTPQHAFLYSFGVMQDLGTLGGTYGEAFSINNAGQIVGESTIAGNMSHHAFVYSGGVMTDLNSLIPAASGLTLAEARSINDRGQIAGVAYEVYAYEPSGPAHAILLTPASPPPPPLFLQTSADPQGSIALLGSSAATVRSAGCYLTSTAIVLEQYGHYIDPVTLNAYLAQDAQAGARDGPSLILESLSPSYSYGQKDGSTGTPVRFSSSRFVGSATREQITNQLAVAISEHGPVMLRVPQIKWGLDNYPLREHFVVAWKVIGEDIFIRDPDGQRTGTYAGGVDLDAVTLEDYIRVVNNSVALESNKLDSDLSWLRTAKYTFAEACTPAICPDMRGVVRSPVDIVITDRLGRRLGRGFDSSLGEWVQYGEIAGSSYDHLPFSLDPDDVFGPVTGETPIEFTVGNVVAGTYTLEVFGTGVGPFQVGLGLSTYSGFDPEEHVFTGQASEGSYSTFTFEVAPEPATLSLLALGGLALLRRRRPA